MKLVVNADLCDGDGLCLGFGPEDDFLSVYDDDPAVDPVAAEPRRAAGSHRG